MNLRFFKSEILLILIGILFSPVIYGQILNDRCLFVKASGIIGNDFGGKISVDYITKRQQCFSIGICGLERLAKNIPNDYISPSGISGDFTFFGLKLDHPKEEKTTFYVSTGKIFKLNRMIRADLSGGLGYCLMKTPENFQKRIPASNSAENYSYDYKNNNSYGIILNPTIDYTWRYFGISLGFISLLSKDRFSYGFEISWLIGLVRNER